MIGPSMDFQTLSRKELQALCKSSGIPANKSNAFMMEALAKKRAPLSQVDTNRENRIDPARKPPLFTNNFLRRGKRKEGDTDGAPGDAHVKKVPKVESSVKSETLPASIGGKDAKVATAGVTSSSDSANSAKGQIEDRIRSQINAALCSKVMKPPETRPSAPTSVGSHEKVLESNAKVDDSEALDFPLENPEQQKELVQAKVESSKVLALPLGRQERKIERFSSPDPLALQITKREEEVSACTSLDLIASPPLGASPFVRHMEERVHSIVDRIQRFWERSSFNSPAPNVTERLMCGSSH